MFEFFKKLKKIVLNYDQDMNQINKRLSATNHLEQKLRSIRSDIKKCENVIKERTTVNADIHMKSGQPSCIILVGKYRGIDYVKVQTVDLRYFNDMVSNLREYSKYANIGIIDACPSVNKAIKQEVF